MGVSGSSVIRPKLRSEARSRLFCFPHAGVGPSVFRGWADELAADVEVCLIQLPAREGRLREKPFLSIAAAVPILTQEMSSLLDRPFAFYGHSLGATLAFECALHLRRKASIQPTHLFAGASPAPHLPWNHAPMRALPEHDFIAEMERRYGVLPREVMSDKEMRDLVLPILRADVGMIETYVHSLDAPLDSDITVFGGALDRMVQRAELEAWRQLTFGRFQTQMLQGDHLFLKPCRAQLLKSIAQELNLYPQGSNPGRNLEETRT